MARTISTILVVLASLWRTTQAFNCSILPIYVDIHKREVHGTDAFQYGSFIGIGSPAQNQSIWPSLRQNETSFAASTFCANSNLTDCINTTGGNFDPSQSTSWAADNGSQTTNLSSSDSSFLSGKDVLHLYTHYFITTPASETLAPEVPVMIGTSGSKSPGILGLGSASTVLQKLYETGLIAARTYSLYIGSGFDRAGGIMNGSNTFGGFDSGRFLKPVHTYKMDLTQPDYLPVTVSDIIIDDANDPRKQKLSIMDDGPFEARISTDRYPMLLPAGITRRFMAAMNAAPANNEDNSLKLNRPFNGTMTIQLSDGFNITLPSSILFNSSGLTPVEATPPDYSGPFYLSASWLSQVYLMLDFEAQQFHLAKAIPIAKYIIPQTLCPSSTPVPHDYNKFAVPYFARNGLVGAVIGGVVGGLALIGFCICAFVAWKRRGFMRAQQRRWDVEEKALAFGQSNVEMQTVGPSVPSPAMPAPSSSTVYHPIEQLREMTPSPVSGVSSMDDTVVGSRPPSLTRDSLVQ